jgi:hypothetical protein
MYFDAYLKGRNPPNPQMNPQGNSQVTGDTAPKFMPLRPPMGQANSIIAKSPYQDPRSDNNRPNTSAHIFLSAAKTSAIPQRAGSNYPSRP